MVRVGDHPGDFERDARAHAFAGPDLPVPETLDRGEGLGCHYAISERARGAPLESIDDWEEMADLYQPSVTEVIKEQTTRRKESKGRRRRQQQA